MEIKAILNKPYTDKERMDFIVTQNHNQGYEIKETDVALEAWGLTTEEKEEQVIPSQLASLEAQTGLIRPMREMILSENSGASDYVKAKARELEDLAEKLRG